MVEKYQSAKNNRFSFSFQGYENFVPPLPQTSSSSSNASLDHYQGHPQGHGHPPHPPGSAHSSNPFTHPYPHPSELLGSSQSGADIFAPFSCAGNSNSNNLHAGSMMPVAGGHHGGQGHGLTPEPYDPEVNSVMSDEELASLNIKDLNRKLKELGLPKAIVEKLKQRRRTLKNRKYATDCREKKDVEVHSLEGSRETEETDLSRIEADNDTLRNNIKRLKQQYQRSLEFARKNNIALKERKNVPLHSSTGGSE